MSVYINTFLRTSVKEVNCINIYDDPTGNVRNVMAAQNDEDRYLIGYLLMSALE
jgi:hypothetical protein